MKKTLFALAAVAMLIPLSVGCSSTGSSSGSSSGWNLCRTGSLWPTSRRQASAPEVVYAGQQCDPCTPNACQPCEPACNPCEPACDPCKPRTISSYTPVTPAPYGG
ncbi:MAG: hypothetical protein ACRC46_09290 [Thermoguttaceae bacterium]